MNNSTIINTFNYDNRNIGKTQYRQIMTTNTSRVSKFKPIFKKPIVAGTAFFTVEYKNI